MPTRATKKKHPTATSERAATQSPETTPPRPCAVANYCGGDADYCGLGCQPLWSFNGECKVLPAPNVTVVTQCLDPKQVAITFDDGPFVYSADIAAAFTAAGGAVTFIINGLNFGCIYNFADGLIAARAAGHQLA